MEAFASISSVCVRHLTQAELTLRGPQRMGHVSTRGIFSEHVAVNRVGTGTGAAAHLAELAHATLAAEPVGLAERPEDGMFSVDRGQWALFHVAARNGQKAAR